MILKSIFAYLLYRHLSDTFVLSLSILIQNPNTIWESHKTRGTGGGFVLLWFSLCTAATGKQGEGDSRVEIDKNSCDRNEECSVLKGLASTPEVCFHSLMEEQKRQRNRKKASKWICFKPPDNSLLETYWDISVKPVCRLAGVQMIRRPN